MFAIVIVIIDKDNKKKFIDENIQYFLHEGTLPNGYKPIVMEYVEENLRSLGAIDTNEFL